MGGDTPSPPPAPDYAAANAAGVFANTALLPSQRQIQALSQSGGSGTVKVPIIVDNGQGAFISGYQDVPVDFSGMGDLDLQAKNQAQMFGLANNYAQGMLDLNAKYGQQYVEQNRAQQQAADPEAFLLRQKLGQQLASDAETIGKGQLSPAQKRLVDESVRSAQTARGNYLGNAPAWEEAFNELDYGNQMKNQEQAKEQAFTFGQPLAGYNTSAAQNGATPFNPVGSQYQVASVDPNAGNNAANFAAQTYGTQMAGYNAQMANKSNPWMSGLGLIGGIGSSLGSAALMCWVAREVYGKDNPRWLEFRKFVISMKDKWFSKYYIQRGEGIAGFLKMNPEYKEGVMNFMEARLA